MLSENSELLAKARHRLPLQYFFMIATGAIGTPCIIIALLNILLGKNLRFPEFDVLIGQQYRIAHDVGLLVVGVICFCAFLSLLHGTWCISRHIRKLNKKVKSETLATEL